MRHDETCQVYGALTINYEYDPLYRLTEANYSNGDYYHYTYDAVGNRLTESNQLAVNSYQYDDANRLTSVNGVTYTWDANGNLLNDGVNAYTYDSANRLKLASNQSTVSSYGYNGLGDRLSQIVNGVTTNYTLDLNAGLTQVLNDGTNAYIYGLGRIAQVNATTEYFLGDALGSVRQLTNASGTITLAKGYTPYGEVMSTAGSGTSPFAYTGEQTDASGLTYLRARYYASGDGRFLSRDTWGGNLNQPITYNKWVYANSNPVFYADHSGLRPECWNQVSAVVGQICAIERFQEILRENNNNGVTALASIFTDGELQNMGGFYAGRTSATRLEWILNLTLGSYESKPLDIVAKFSCALPGELLAFHLQFAFAFPSGDNSGLPIGLEDSQFYDGITWTKKESNQIGHFLSAVSTYYYGGRDLELIIAHEQSTDPCFDWQTPKKCGSEFWDNITGASPADRSHFYKAWHYDTNGMYAERDQELWAILKFDSSIVKNLGDVDPARGGNSLQDLRLSLRGVRFADWIMSNRSSLPSEAGQWLMTNLPLP